MRRTHGHAEIHASKIGGSAVSNKGKDLEATLTRLRDVFQGVTGRQPKSDAELKRWLATAEGKQATVFESTELFMWGEMHGGAVRDPAEEKGFQSDQLHE
jgi:hypothetical protein